MNIIYYTMKYKIIVIGVILLFIIPNINIIESKSIDEKIDDIFILFYIGRISNLKIDGDEYNFDSNDGVWRISYYRGGIGEWSFSISRRIDYSYTIIGFDFHGIINEQFIFGFFT